jgi:ABC-type nitrate/sulfonate/bicarbonate transport system ATPase subunit
VAEGRRLFPKLTVEENLLLGAYRPQARAHIAKNLAFCYETFDVLRQRRRQLAGSMSGGQQQMLAIARALMSSPRLLVVDEPSVGLAPILVSRTMEMIAEMKQRLGLTVLMAEQNFHQAVRIADRLSLLLLSSLLAPLVRARLTRGPAAMATSRSWARHRTALVVYVLTMQSNYPGRCTASPPGTPSLNPGSGPMRRGKSTSTSPRQEKKQPTSIPGTSGEQKHKS